MQTRIFQGLLLVITIFILGCADQSQKVKTDIVIDQSFPLTISKKDICMVDNKVIKDSLMLMVEIEGKKYYGCCEPCIEYLLSDESIRFSIDPYSKENINKADAFIVSKNSNEKEVMYFESEKSYLLFTNK